MREQPSPTPTLILPSREDSAYCVEHTVDGMIRHELTSKKQLARRGGYWDVVGDDYYYFDSDQSDSEDNESDQDEVNKNVGGDILEELD